MRKKGIGFWILLAGIDLIAAQGASLPAVGDYRLADDRSRILIQVYRAGLLAGIGHNHLLAAGEIHGAIRIRNDGDVSAWLRFPVSAIRVDDRELRRMAGPQFSSTPDAESIAATRRNMLGEKVLDAARFPQISMQLLSVDCRAGICDVIVDIRVKDVKKRYSVALQWSWEDGVLRISGNFPVRQSDFDMQPFSVLGGALRVADRLHVGFELLAIQE